MTNTADQSPPSRKHSGWRARALADTRYWIERARALTRTGARCLAVPEVRFDLRGRAAGQAVFARHGQDCHIRLNAALLESHPREMLAETVPHEVAHVVVYRLYGRRAKPHGEQWQSLMRAFGVAPEPCHSLPSQPARRLKYFRYACGCNDPAWLTSIRHKRASRGTVYLCRHCGWQLTRAAHGDD